MYRMKRIVLSIVIVAGFGMTMAPAVAQAATATQTACAALTSDANTSCTDTSGGANVNTLVKTIINILSVLVGVVAVIMIIVGGLKYITSNGDSSAISSAKNTIIYAIIGLVIVAMAQFIVQFVINRTTNPPKKSGFVTGHKTQVGTAANPHYVLNYHLS